MAEKKPYELAFCMAGAVSAGAYTAGVMDFIIQALDEWQQAKDRNHAQHGDNYDRWDVPWHDVVIRAMSGASAGGMTAAIAGASIGGLIEPIRRPEDEGKYNNLYDAWVKMVDIRPLLGDSDLKNNGPIISLLDSSLIDRIADEIVNQRFGTGTNRPYFDKNLQLFLTVTNTRGVPFRFNLGGNTAKCQFVYDHADILRFEVSSSGQQRFQNGVFISAAQGAQSAEAKRLLGEAAKATGAFPVGLASRVINRSTIFYSEFNREYNMFDYPPEWGLASGENRDYTFVASDGGVLNNEPFELARRALLPENDRKHGRNPTEPQHAHRTVIMIDPFPSDQSFDWDYEPNRGIFKLAGGLIKSFRNQAYFDYDTLRKAADEDIYSRKLIAPSRTEGGVSQNYALACGVFDGFSGFLAKEYREHDFFLGRRNAQQFLKKYFTIPLSAARNNPVLGDWTQRGQLEDFYFNQQDGNHMVPIIPLVGRAAEDTFKYAWPVNKYHENDLRQRIEFRTNALLDTLLKEMLSGLKPAFIQAPVRHGIRNFARKKAVNSVMSAIKKGLWDAGLITN